MLLEVDMKISNKKKNDRSIFMKRKEYPFPKFQLGGLDLIHPLPMPLPQSKIIINVVNQ